MEKSCTAGRPRGLRKTGGRRKGTPNRITRSLREAIESAFNEAGGSAYLVRVAHEDPRTFCALLAKTIPPTTVASPGYMTHEEALRELEGTDD